MTQTIIFTIILDNYSSITNGSVEIIQLMAFASESFGQGISERWK